MPTDTTEKGLETIIENYLVNKNHYVKGFSDKYNVDYALDTNQVETFLFTTQQNKVEASGIFGSDHERHKFFERLKNDITKRGIIDVLRKGFRYNTTHFDMYYPLPSELSEFGQDYYNRNIFCETRQLHFSRANADLSIDMVIFINGMPVVTMELKIIIQVKPLLML